MNILIVEDSLDYVNIYQTLIKKMGHNPFVASNGVEAIDLIEKIADIALVILDINLPDFDGIDLCKILREKSSDPSIYIILVTGDSNIDIQKESLDSGADDFLAKPIDLGLLESRIKVGLRSVNAQRQLIIEKERAESLLLENIVYSYSFNQSQQPAIISDEDGLITHINQAVSDVYGYSKEELEGTKTSVFSAGKEVYEEHGISNEEFEERFKKLWDYIKDPEIGYWDGYVYNKTKSGQVKEVHLRIKRIASPSGEAIGYLALLLDMTELLDHERSIRNSCYHTIVDLAELRDNETGEHLTRMSIYARILAEYLELGSHFIHQIEEFASFHDIGKVGIPDSILLAPRKLTDDEFRIIKSHSQIGYDILKNSETLKFAAEIALTHHEKYNGKGYPNGLSGEDIPISGRIIALADVYDALRSRRPYKDPWPHEKVVELIKSERGEHFDPKIVWERDLGIQYIRVKPREPKIFRSQAQIYEMLYKEALLNWCHLPENDPKRAANKYAVENTVKTLLTTRFPNSRFKISRENGYLGTKWLERYLLLIFSLPPVQWYAPHSPVPC